MMIDDLPDAPDPASDAPAIFSQKAAAMVLAQKNMIPQINAAIVEVNAAAESSASDAEVAASAAIAAQAAADAAAFTTNVTDWVSGNTYTKGVCVWSPVNLQTYRRKVAGAGATDPSTDTVNWQGIERRSTFTPVPVAALDIDLRLGDVFTKTISTSSTFTFSGVPAGGSSFMLKLRMDGGSAAFPAGVRPAGGAMPSMSTGKTHRIMFVTEDGGTTWGMVVAPNFTN